MSKAKVIKKGFLKSITNTSKGKTRPYDTSATVTRVENGMVYVHIPGGAPETPVEQTINASVGDVIKVRVANSRAWITGNATAPPTDDTVAKEANEGVRIINKTVKVIKTTLDKVGEVAGNTAQYFWHTETGTDTGVHITEVPREDFLEDPENGGGNLLARSVGIAIRNGLTELATFTANKVSLGKNSPTAQIYLCDEHGRIYYADNALVLSGEEATGIRSQRYAGASAQMAVASSGSQLAANTELRNDSGNVVAAIYTSASGVSLRGASIEAGTVGGTAGKVVTANDILLEGYVRIAGKIKHGEGRRYYANLGNAIPSDYRLVGVRGVETSHNQYLRITAFGAYPGAKQVFAKVFNATAGTDYPATGTDAAYVYIYWFAIKCTTASSVEVDPIRLPDDYNPDD